MADDVISGDEAGSDAEADDSFGAGQTPSEAMRHLRATVEALAAEAAPLFEAVRESLGSQGADVDPSATGRESPDRAQESTCQSCPVCRVLDAVRDVRPEAVQHLRLALDHLTAAVTIVVSSADHGAAAGPTRAGAEGGVWPPSARVWDAATDGDSSDDVPVQRIEVE